MAKKKNIADRIISGEYDKEWLQENKKNKEVIKQSREEQQSSLKLPTKENTSNIQLKNNNISNENFSTNNINLGRLQRNNSNNFFNVNDNTRRIQSIGLPMRNKQEAVRKILSTGIGIKYGENAGKIANDTIGSVQNLLSSAKTGIMQFGKTLNERLVDKQNNDAKLTQAFANIAMKDGKESSKEKAQSLLQGYSKLNGLNYNQENNNIEEIKYEEANKDIQNKIDEENKKMQETVEDSKTKVGKLATEFTSSLGNNLVGGAVSSINPMLGATYFVGSATGSYEDDARERGMEGNGAKLYSGVMGGIEGTLDYLLGFGSLKSGFKAIGKENVGKAVAKFGETLLGNGLENAFQEGITEPIQELVATITNGKDKANWDNIGQRIFKSTIFGFASGAIFHGVGRGLGSISNIQNKINNGEMLSPTDLQNVTQELEKSGMSKEEIFETAKNNALEAVNAEVQRIKQEEQQTEVNKTNTQEQEKQEIISRMNNNQQSNNISQEQISSLVERIDKSNLPNEDKLMMKDYIQNNNVSQADIDSMNNVIDSAVSIPANNELVTNQNFKDNVEARKKYSKYKNDTGEYNSKAIDEVLDLIPENRNGNRTVKQWLQVAKETGTRIADLSNEEIERIAYKSWFDVQPSKNITKYDRQSKSTVGFQKLTSDEWINEINRAVNEARNNQEQNGNSNKSSFSYDEINSKISNNSDKNKLTDKGITMTYVHMNNQNTENYGTMYGQKIEPSGEYMNVDTMEGKYKVPGADYGTIHFDNPLILDHINTGETGWKKSLSDMFNNKTGKELSDAVKKAGYDGIITIDENGYYNEVVNLDGKKNNNTLENRVSGDTLLNAQDLIDELKEVGAKVDDNGYVTVYHQTTKENADNIMKTGKMSAKEDGIFFSTSKNATQAEGRGDTKIEFKIPVEDLVLDDIFDDNADVRIPLKNSKETIDVSKYLTNEVTNNQENNKQKQLDIIQKNNPMTDDYHTGIRSIEDIKTFDEVINDDESFVYGDFSKEDAEKALKEGKVTVYSSKPIEQGSFVSTSQNMAKDYAGNGKIYSQEVDLKDVAWINGDEGQYARLENNQETLYNNNESESDINDRKRNEIENGRNFQESEQQDSNGGRSERRTSIELDASTKKLTNYKEKLAIINNAKNNIQKVNASQNMLDVYNDLGINLYGYNEDITNHDGLTHEGEVFINNASNNSREIIGAHELVHALRQNNNEIYNKEIQPIINDVANNDEYRYTLVEYLRDNNLAEGYLDDKYRNMLAEEVVGNVSAEILSKYEKNHYIGEDNKTKLEESLMNITKGRKFVTDNENSNQSSFIMPTAENNKTDNQKMPMNKKQEQEKVANILEKPQQQVKEKDRTWAILKAGLLDKGIVFEELSHKTKNRELQSKWDYTLSATARGQNAIGNARYEFDPKTKKQKQISKSLEDIRAEVGDRISDFNQYMYHLLNIDRMTLEERFGGDTGTNFENNGNITNKPVFSKDITADISRGIVEKLENKHSDFKDIAQDVYDYNNANKQELVRNGVISQELSDKLAEMYPHYVPIKRVDVKGSAIKVPLDTNRMGINSPLARATGGNSDIQPLFETMADRTMQTYRAGARNNFGVELLNTLNSQIESNNVDVDTIIDEIGSEDTELLKEGKNGENPTFTVFNNGEKTTFEITKDMYDALKPISDGSLLNKKILKGIPNKISNLRRGVLTEYNPLFSITNALKDAQDVIVNSQHTAKTFSKFPEAYSQILKKGYWFKEYVQNGGEQNSYFKDGEFTSDKKVPTAKKALSVPLNAISNVNNVIEMAPRLAEYIASREAGRSVETSMLDASRVTTNFKAGGDITKFANRNGATFLNASVQGFQQQIRNIKEANVKGLKGYAVLAGKYTVAGVIPAIINSLIWKDDKDYEDLQDYVKDNYYCIAKLGDGKFIRIPKGRMVATLQKIVSNIGEYMTDDKKLNIDNFAKDFWEDLKFGMDNVAPNNPLDNNVISPVIQAISNKSWYGEDIVPSRLQKKPDAQQYDETTDSLSKWLGEKLNKSPYKINYLLDQYSGGVGDIVLPMMTKQAENNAIEDKFTTDSVMKSKYPGKFFELKDQLETNNVSDYATDEDKLKYKYINEISSELSDLYNKKREIQNSNMSDKDKKAKLKEVQKDINIIAKDGIDNVGKIKADKNTATIDDKQYYKYKNEWTELSDKDKEKTKNISLSTFADYRNKVYELTKQKKESEENIKSEDKIQLLLDSKYSNKDKEELYKNYIGSNDSIFNTIKSSGMNIDEYLKYRQKNLNKEKKDVVIRYLNSMNITGNQRLLLYALHRYKTDNNQKNQLVKYVKNFDMNNEEKLKLISKFSGFKVYKNGKITY